MMELLDAREPMLVLAAAVSLALAS